MTVSFKQFNAFIDNTVDASAEKIDEVFGKIFGRSEDKEGKKEKLTLAQQKLADKKKADEDRRNALKKKRDEEWLKAKERTERGNDKGYPQGGYPSLNGKERDDYAQHRTMREDRQTFEPGDQQTWTTQAKAAGFQVKKIAGNKEDGDETWAAFDGDEKMGEFSAKGGYLAD